jgi:hypothetical protein
MKAGEPPATTRGFSLGMRNTAPTRPSPNSRSSHKPEVKRRSRLAFDLNM